jgi:hypothetical protein
MKFETKVSMIEATVQMGCAWVDVRCFYRK